MAYPPLEPEAGGVAGVIRTRGRKFLALVPEEARKPKSRSRRWQKNKKTKGAPEAAGAADPLGSLGSGGAGLQSELSRRQCEHFLYGGVLPFGGAQRCLRFRQCEHVCQPSGRRSIGCNQSGGGCCSAGRDEGAEELPAATSWGVSSSAGGGVTISCWRYLALGKGREGREDDSAPESRGDGRETIEPEEGVREIGGTVEGDGSEDEGEGTVAWEASAGGGTGSMSGKESSSVTPGSRLPTSCSKPSMILGARLTQSEVANGSTTERAEVKKSSSLESEDGSIPKGSPRLRRLRWKMTSEATNGRKKNERTILSSNSSTQSRAASLEAAESRTFRRLSTALCPCTYCSSTCVIASPEGCEEEGVLDITKSAE